MEDDPAHSQRISEYNRAKADSNVLLYEQKWLSANLSINLNHQGTKIITINDRMLDTY